MDDDAECPAIPFFNYQRAFAGQADNYIEILRDVLSRGAFIQQRDLELFETHFAERLGVRHALGVGNGTDGLLIAFRAAGIESGDEVLIPSHTMVATAAAAVHCGGTPVLVDCGADHLIDVPSAEAAVTSRTRFIVPVHLNGRVADMDAVEAMAARHHLTIIEDAAQALGARYKGRPAGSFGKAAAFSFYPAKILGCFGDGGAVVTNDDEVAHHVRLLRDHGRDQHGETRLWGLNSRLDNLQAAILDFQLKQLTAAIERRRAIAARYEGRLADIGQLVLPPGPESNTDHFDVFQNYELEAERRDALREHLRTNGVGTVVQWGGRAVHQFPALGLHASLPATERLFQRCLMLPMNLTLKDDDVDRIASLVRAFYGC